MPRSHFPRRFIVAAWAVWKLGATPQPLSSRIVPAELEAILELCSPSLVIAETAITDAVPCWDTTGASGLSVSVALRRLPSGTRGAGLDFAVDRGELFARCSLA